MNRTVKETTKLLELLPEKEQDFTLEFIKKLVLAWDPDYTKTTSEERTTLVQAMKDFKKGDTISHDSINWG